MFFAILHGFLLALSLILPLGAQNIFIFNQGTLSKQLMAVFPAILTAALSDTLLIFLAVAGVSLVILTFPILQNVLVIVGFIFLIIIGWSIWKNSNRMDHVRFNHLSSPKKQIVFALSVSLLNPHAILDTIGVIGTSALNYSGLEKWAFAAACAFVSWAWFFSLALAGHFFGGTSFGKSGIVVMNKVSALIIWLLALLLLIRLACLL
ncbi:MAG: LysE/ArgO family amino acid transporter [Sporolactobacillus sp.]